MKRTLIAAGAAAVLAIGGGVWVGLGSATASTTTRSMHGWPISAGSAASTIASVKADAAQSGSEVLLLREHTVSETDIDVGDSGFGPGDYFIFESELRYLHGSQVIGRDSVRCTVGPDTFICDATAHLFGKGKVVAYGAAFAPSDPVLAVTGGTADFKDVGGQLKVAEQRGDDLLAFEITR